MRDDQLSAPGAKLITAWLAAIGISSWSDLAAILAALYSLLLTGELLWKWTIRYRKARDAE